MANKFKEERHVKVTVDGFDIHGRAGRHAHIEHPVRSIMWQTPCMKHMLGYDAILDQCA